MHLPRHLPPPVWLSKRPIMAALLRVTGLLCICLARALGVMRFAMASHHSIEPNSIAYHLLVDGEIKSISKTISRQQQALAAKNQPIITFSSSPQDGTQASLDIAHIQITDTAPLIASIHQHLQSLDYRPSPCPTPCLRSVWTQTNARATIEIIEHANHQRLDIIKSELS